MSSKSGFRPARRLRPLPCCPPTSPRCPTDQKLANTSPSTSAARTCASCCSLWKVRARSPSPSTTTLWCPSP
ncbi:hypothetical protein L596_005231 [Steinernema carpocapsae]|uniref:Uncharacterized protein n=1 Tax=Steinernema carpocapsae TaxID=34508 RepID=A0A4U8UZT7_STECR|nr:hypothetical protein L596_005231 [Steinernema carpocapsae]